MNLKGFHILFFFLAITSLLNAQEYIGKITPFPENQNIGSIISYFFEDSRGYMWIPGKGRICRFDGVDYKPFFHDKAVSHTKTCIQINEDIEGNIWVYFLDKLKDRGIYEGQFRYLIDKNFEIQNIDDYFKNKMPFKSSDILQLYQNQDRVFYMLTNGWHLYKYDGQFKKLTTLPLSGRPLINQINEKGEIFITAPNAIWKVSSDGKQVEKKDYFLASPNHSANFSPKDSSSIKYFFDGILKHTKTTQLKHLYAQKLVYPKFWNNLSDNEIISAFYLESKGKVVYLILTEDKFVLFDKMGKLIFDFPYDVEVIGRPNRFNSRFFYRENQIWCVTNKGGYILNYAPKKFKNYFNHYGFSTRGIMTYKNNLWALSNSNIRSQDLVTNAVKSDTLKRGNNLWGICESGDNDELLLGASKPYIFKYHTENKTVKRIGVRQKDRLNNAQLKVFTPFKSKSNNIYGGSTKGLFICNAATDSLEAFQKYNEFEALKTANIQHFKEDKEGIWLITSNGLFLLNEQKGIVKSVDALPDFPINHFHREDSIFWLTTYGKGLIRFNEKTKKFQKFGTENGFFSEYLTAIYPDNQGFLWIASEKGLIKFNPQTYQSQIFFESDGLTDNEFNRGAHFRNQNGEIFLGGLDGAISFHPDSISFQISENTPFVLTDFEVYNAEKEIFENKYVQYQKEEVIKLSPNERTFQIHFSLLNYFETDKTRFAYTIEGLFSSWIQIDENHLLFNEIPYGNHTLKIKAKTNSENWNEQEIVIPLIITPPFYRQIHWQILFGVFVLFLIFMSYRLRIYSLKKEQIMLEEMVKERTQTIHTQNQELKNLNQTKDRLFAILAHDLRNPVLAFKSLSKSINYLIQNQETQRIQELGKFIEKEANQLHHLLDNLLTWALASQEKLTVQSTTVNLFGVVEKIINDYQHLSELSKVRLVNKIPTETPIFADRRILETVFRNIVTNAFRYTGANDSITFSISQKENVTEILITDTGEGMTEEQLEQLFKIKSNTSAEESNGKISIGLHLCQELIKLLGGKISAESELSKGSVFRIELPKRMMKDERER